MTSPTSISTGSARVNNCTTPELVPERILVVASSSGVWQATTFEAPADRTH